MNKLNVFLILICFTFSVNSQEKKEAFGKGEWLKYRIHYGFVNAGYATLTIDEVEKEEQQLYHFVGKGWTTGMTNWFFKVRDTYESYVDKTSKLPSHFVRRVDEGGYKINRDIYFNQGKNSAKVEDHKRNTTKEVTIDAVQDMISSFYFLRNEAVDSLKIGESVSLRMFFDGKTFPFKLKFFGKEVLKTKFGKVACYKFRPSVKSGRVFKEDESLTVWVSADENKIPIRIKASLAVGSIKVDLYKYKGLSNPFPVIL